MKWKPPCPCPEDTSGVAVHTERRLEKQSLFLSMYPQDITCLSPPPKRPTLSHRSSRDLHKGPRDRDVPQNCPEPREQPHLHPGLHCQSEAMAGEQHWHPHVVTGIRVSSQPKSALQRGILLTRTTSGPTPAAPCPSYAGDPQRWKEYYRGIL